MSSNMPQRTWSNVNASVWLPASFSITRVLLTSEIWGLSLYSLFNTLLIFFSKEFITKLSQKMLLTVTLVIQQPCTYNFVKYKIKISKVFF